MKGKVYPPLIHVGDVIGNLTITEYLGVEAEEGRNSRTHFYASVCKCGNKVPRLPQIRLRGVRRRTSCNPCADKQRKQHRAPVSPVDIPHIFDLWPAHSTDGGYA